MDDSLFVRRCRPPVVHEAEKSSVQPLQTSMGIGFDPVLFGRIARFRLQQQLWAIELITQKTEF